MRPPVAPLGEPTRIVAVVRGDRDEQCRRGSELLGSTGPRTSRRGQFRGSRPGSDIGDGAEAIANPFAFSTRC